jgi:2-polyprenyl-3-methyl-5-hydroxy-6-metoxy-1,4-benzoquinol methylase
MTAYTELCPLCMSGKIKDISPHLHLCRSCRSAFNTNYAPARYNDDYFLGEYRRQYGKTYVEDYKTINSFSRNRLSWIFEHIGQGRDRSGLSLLDIGSAAGFFLQCAREAGIKDVTGIEISEYASRYCSEHFSIPVVQSSFNDITLSKKYDIITAWFFIEHCEDTVRVLNKISDMLADGGLFAFSGPSTFGPLFALNRQAWIETHPADHRVDFSPRSAKTILSKFGFRKIYTRPAGIHPERVIPTRSFAYRPFSHLYKIFSRVTSFSDTIEVIALK